MTVTKVSAKVGNNEITIETGKMAKQADGSVTVSCGNNIVLVTVVSSKRDSDADFFPLTVEYQEKFYSTGRIPGGFLKREGRPSNEAILNCRLIDRPLRPTFPEGYNKETQIVATTLSTDNTFPLDILALIGASTASHISDIPFNGPVASVVVGRVDGNFVANPNPTEKEKSDFELTVSGTKNGILMVEGETKFVSEAEILQAIKFAFDSIQPVITVQDELRSKVGKAKREFTPFTVDPEFRQQVTEFLQPKVEAALRIREKLSRYEAVDASKKEAEEKFLSGLSDSDLALRSKELGIIVGDVKYNVARGMILKDKIRIDGRDTVTVRPITTEVNLLPRCHGSALFTRGETQVLGAVTLGTADDEKMIDSLEGVSKKQFLLHYNFPPYSVGETGRMGGQSRREIGHGSLAERALKNVIPDHADFPYTIRMVGEVFESNGSSSMGTVCAGTHALLDAGVPIKANIAGVAMGLIKEGSDVAVLTDILGDEDHLGDMDFKVAGSRDGITALQMDLKIDSVSFDIMEQALAQAKDGRNHILSEMEKTLSSPRGEISEFAPRIEILQIKAEKIKDVIGPSGKVIKGIIEETGVKINIDDSGRVEVASTDPEMRMKAVKIINDIIAEAEVGKTYKGKVVKITDFGAFVDILPNNSGLLHISEIAHERIRQVTDVLKEGEEVEVKVLDVDRQGRIKLSRKALLPPPE